MIDWTQKLKTIKTISYGLAALLSDIKNQVLQTLAEQLIQRSSEIIEANRQDLQALNSGESSQDYTSAFKDRLTLTSERLAHMAQSLREVIALPDVVGEVLDQKTLKNGLKTKKVRTPLGVIFLVFESRPNVAIESFSLAFKSGNALILKGGKESRHTLQKFYEVMQFALQQHGVDPGAVLLAMSGEATQDRELTHWLLKQKKFIDVVIPRGGDRLIEMVTETSLIPLIKNDRGLCHLYIANDLIGQQKIVQIVKNAKMQRPGVCNSVETLLIHEQCAPTLLTLLFKEMNPVVFYGCPQTFQILNTIAEQDKATSGIQRLFLADEQSYHTEYLDYKINIQCVPDLSAAIDHIRQHGSRHTEGIITDNQSEAHAFMQSVDAAVVVWNASTRFTDGHQLGLGGEIGISTQKLHARGPVGMRELTSLRWWIEGEGQIRE
jgi:glutamate-5-semialdehyde dehydrogenase